MISAGGYGVLVKPKVLGAMLALYVTSFLSSFTMKGTGRLDSEGFLLGLTAVATAVAGANALNCYFDRDIDALMARTWSRPLVQGTIGTTGALSFSSLLLFVASIISIYLGFISLIIFLEGALSYLLLYTILLKRRTRLNVFATAPSVAAPVWFGWHLGGAPLYPMGVFMGLIVAIWGPLHLWSLAYAYSKDYVKAAVPMLPNVTRGGKAIHGITLALSILIGSSYLPLLWARLPLYFTGVTLANALLLVFGLRFLKNRSPKSGWIIFKLTAPYIISLMLLFLLDLLLFSN